MKVIDTRSLLEALKRAQLANVNRQLPDSVVDRLDPDGKHIFSNPIWHCNYQGVESIRPALGLLKLRGEREPLYVILDFLPDDYNEMPDYDKDTAARAQDATPSGGLGA